MNSVKELLQHIIERMSEAEVRQLLEFAQHLQRRHDDSLTLKRLDAALLLFILGISSSQGGRLYSIRPANGALCLHPRYGFWTGSSPSVESAPTPLR